jgi:large subunit ribosomal protein L6
MAKITKIKGSKKDYSVQIEVPSEIETTITNNLVSMKKNGKETKKIMNKLIQVTKEGNNIKVEVKNAGRREKREFGTIKSHIKNMIEGLMNGYEYDLEICIVHFPMTVTFDKTKKEFIIKNLLGEKSPRIIGVCGDVEVEIKAPIIKIKSHDLEAAGQTAANLEKISKIRNRDRNKFQDGIFITKKPGKIYV